MRALVLGIFALQLFTIYFIHRNRRLTMADIDVLNDSLDAIAAEVSKIASEQQTLIDELAAANQNPAVDLSGAIAKATAIQAKLQSLDDLVPDAPDEPVSDTPAA